MRFAAFFFFVFRNATQAQLPKLIRSAAEKYHNSPNISTFISIQSSNAFHQRYSKFPVNRYISNNSIGITWRCWNVRKWVEKQPSWLWANWRCARCCGVSVGCRCIGIGSPFRATMLREHEKNNIVRWEYNEILLLLARMAYGFWCCCSRCCCFVSAFGVNKLNCGKRAALAPQSAPPTNWFFGRQCDTNFGRN